MSTISKESGDGGDLIADFEKGCHWDSVFPSK